MEVHLLDGTYELFRHFHALPRRANSAGEEVAAVRGVLRSVLGMLEDGATHIGVATDHVIESFRNDLWPGYKTGEGIEPELLAQFPLLEEALDALGVVVWAMTDLEADDALAAAALRAGADPGVSRVLICTPDKDLAQAVRGRRIVQFDRRRRELRDSDGVLERFGVSPQAIPDYLALVGDTADGFPGLPGWGPKSAASVLGYYQRIEDVPPSAHDWDVAVRGAERLAETLSAERDRALLFRDLATLRAETALFEDVDELRWHGPTERLSAIAGRLDDPALTGTATRLARVR